MKKILLTVVTIIAFLAMFGIGCLTEWNIVAWIVVALCITWLGCIAIANWRIEK